MTAYESASLVAQWFGVGVGVATVLVAAVFGYLTLVNNRRSKDNQERATYAAADSSDSVEPASDRTPSASDESANATPRVEWEVIHEVGENWLLRNAGPSTAYDVKLRGYTVLDHSRLTGPSEATELEPSKMLRFVFVSRLAKSGPGNVVVVYSLANGGPRVEHVLRVPAP